MKISIAPTTTVPLLVAIFAIAVGSSKLTADILEVGPGKTFATINAGYNAASSGDIVRVFDGTYAETLFVTKDVRFESNRIGGATIDGGGTTGALITVRSNAAFSGFHITNARSGIIVGAGASPNVNVDADRILATDFEAAFGVNTPGPRNGLLNVRNSTVWNSANAFNINDGDTINTENMIISDVNTAYVNHNGNNITTSYNLLHNVGTRSATSLGGNVTGDLNEILANPLFQSPGFDFSLMAGSPAIDSGINNGLPFRGLSIDRGAFEFAIPEPSTVGLLGLCLVLGMTRRVRR